MLDHPEKTLLIIEDDSIYAEFIHSSLSTARLPLNLQRVSNVADALAYLRGEPPYQDRTAHPMPTTILLDINLSHQSGFAVLGFLRDHGHLENEKIRVIMLTASDRSEDLQKALQIGAVSYLIKSPLASTIINIVSKFALN